MQEYENRRLYSYSGKYGSVKTRILENFMQWKHWYKIWYLEVKSSTLTTFITFLKKAHKRFCKIHGKTSAMKAYF